MKTSLDRGVRKHFDRFTLKREQINYLKSIQEGTAWRIRKVRTNLLFPVLAGVVLVLLVLVQIAMNRFSNTSSMLQELFVHHRNSMPLEIKSETMDGIRLGLSELDFQVRWPEKKMDSHWKIVGGRYVKTAGSLGAEIRLINNKSGRLATLFEFKKIENFKPASTKKRHSTVQTWAEGNRVFGFVFD